MKGTDFFLSCKINDLSTCMEIFLYINEKVELSEFEIKNYVVKNKYYK